MPGSMSFSCATGRMMLAPLMGCCFIRSNSSSVSLPGFFRTRSSTPILPTSCSSAEMRRRSRSSAVQAHVFADDDGIFRDAAGVTTGVGILFVDGRGEHADGAEEQLAIFRGGLLQAFDVLLDVARHVVESFGELADFGGAVEPARVRGIRRG